MNSLTRTLVVLTVSLAGILPAAASAHQGDSNYRSEINSIRPAEVARGLQLEIENFDDHLVLANRTGKEVVIEGYDGEPYFRISADGLVEVNLNSPSYYLNEDRFANVELPARADAKAQPEWQEIDQTGRYIWHDHRSHYMGVGTPSQVKDESKETLVFRYTIPMSVDGVPVKASGTLTWAGKQAGPPFFIWVLLAVLIIGGLLGAIVVRRRRSEEDERNDGPGTDSGKQKEAW